MIDNYYELKNRVQDFGDIYFNNTGKELLDEMEAYIYGESDKFEKDIMENVLQSASYSEKIKKEAEELLESANMERRIMTTDLQEIIKNDSAFNDTFIQDEELEPKWELVKTKIVFDDGLLTNYSWYKNNEGHHIMILGDTDLYTPYNSSSDFETDNEAEAKEWFANYEGSESTEDLFENYTDETWDYHDNTPSGIINLYDSIEDSDVNDIFIQDDIEDPNDEKEVMLYNKRKTIVNSYEALLKEIKKRNLTKRDLEKPENKDLNDYLESIIRAYIKVEDMLNNYKRERKGKITYSKGFSDENPNTSENQKKELKIKAALEYVASAIDDAKIENDYIVQTITLYNDDFDFDDDYSELDDGYYKVSDRAIENTVERYTEGIAGEYLDKETDLGFDFEVDYDYDYDSDAHVSLGSYSPATYWEPEYQDRDEGGSVEINIYYYVKIK